VATAVDRQVFHGLVGEFLKLLLVAAVDTAPNSTT
jgi:hypothetical protein